MNALVSCVIPVYNGERFLGETLESVLAQSHPLHEVIVVDDGSTDGTRGIVEKYGVQSAKRVRYLWQTNSGPATARNKGIQAATGEFIALNDADDLWHPEKIARQLAQLVARPELGISVTHIQNFWMDEVAAEEERLQGHARTKPVAGYNAPALLVRRSVFEQLGLFDVTLPHTHIAAWFLQAEEQGIAVELLADVLVYRRLHLDNRSRKLAHTSRQEYLRFLQMVRSRRRAAPVSTVQNSTAHSSQNERS
jgi:glycosyltransferase involved in cell wall biosynthesis